MREENKVQEFLNGKGELSKEDLKWVCKSVLPSIRKDGAYVMGEENGMSEDEITTKAMAIMHSKVERLKTENKNKVDEV